MNLLGICGSIRAGSYNRLLLRAAQRLVPEGTCEIAGVGELPLFDEDLEALGDPEPVAALKERVRGSDAVLIATPEYNWGVPGPLKNAFDWISRPVATNVLKRKPVAVLGASTGPWGTVRAQLALRQSLVYTDSFTLPTPWLYVAHAEGKFGSAGELSDERVAAQLRDLLESLARWTEQVAPR